MNKENTSKTGKIRQNVSLSPKIKGDFEVLADAADTSMSALLTTWIKDAMRAKQEEDQRKQSPPLSLVESDTTPARQAEAK